MASPLDDDQVPPGKGNRERRVELARKNGLCRYCRPGRGCNWWSGSDRPRPDRYKSRRKGK